MSKDNGSKPFPWSILAWPVMWVFGWIAEKVHERLFIDFDLSEPWDDYDEPRYVDNRVEVETFKAADPFWYQQEDGSFIISTDPTKGFLVYENPRNVPDPLKVLPLRQRADD